MLGQALRRSGTASRLLSQCGPSSSSAPAQQLAQQLQQQAGFAKKGGETVDSRLQKVLKMLEPREIEDIEISEEDYAEGLRRCARRRRRQWRQVPLSRAELACLQAEPSACIQVYRDAPCSLLDRNAGFSALPATLPLMLACLLYQRAEARSTAE